MSLTNTLTDIFTGIAGEISGWLIVGILLAGILPYAIPDISIHPYLCGGLTSMLIMRWGLLQHQLQAV